MRPVRSSVVLIVAAAASLTAGAAVAWAAPDIVVRSNENKTYDCRGGSLTVEGGFNVLTLRNCSELIVNGGENTIDAGVLDAIEVAGADNKITWTESPDGRRPRITNEGEGNVIASKRAAAGATAKAPAPTSTAPKTESTSRVTVAGDQVKVQGPDGSVTVGAGGSVTLKEGTADASTTSAAGRIRVDQDGRRETLDCRGASAVVNGDKNVLTFSNCDQVSVNGQGNSVAVRGVQAVMINGNDNTLTWEPAADGSRPRVTDNGRGNTVSGKR
jgi:hypothetical protein